MHYYSEVQPKKIEKQQPTCLQMLLPNCVTLGRTRCSQLHS